MASRPRALSCPHVKVGVKVDEWLSEYHYMTHRSEERFRNCKCNFNCTAICLRCGEKFCKNDFESEHAKRYTCHKIVILMETMELWCYQCKRSPIDYTGRLNAGMIKLRSIKYFGQNGSPLSSVRIDTPTRIIQLRDNVYWITCTSQ